MLAQVLRLALEALGHGGVPFGQDAPGDVAGLAGCADQGVSPHTPRTHRRRTTLVTVRTTGQAQPSPRYKICPDHATRALPRPIATTTGLSHRRIPGTFLTIARIIKMISSTRRRHRIRIRIKIWRNRSRNRRHKQSTPIQIHRIRHKHIRRGNRIPGASVALLVV